MDNKHFNIRSDFGTKPPDKSHPIHPMSPGTVSPFLEWCSHQTCGRPSRYSRAGGTAAAQHVQTSLRHPCSPVRRRALQSRAYLDQQDCHCASVVCEGAPIGAVARLRVVDVQLVPYTQSGGDYSAVPQAIALAFAAVATQVLAHHTLVIGGMAY
jgi:hypothetical protein